MSGVVFMGSKASGLGALERLAAVCGRALTGVITLDDSSDARSVLPAIQERAAAFGVPCHVLTKPSQQAESIRALTPRLVVVAGWYWLLSAEVLALAPLGFVGCHASLLPKYRGSAPLVWAILRGETETGVTLFHFDAGMDSGDIIAQEQFSIGSDDTIAETLTHAENCILRLIETNVPLLLAGTAPRMRQDETAATYASARSAEDGVIDWKQPAFRVHDFIRAQTKPYPGAFTHTPDRGRLRVWKSSVFPRPFYGVPGLVCQREGEAVVVACGDGAVVVRECSPDDGPLQPAGKLLQRGWRLN